MALLKWLCLLIADLASTLLALVLVPFVVPLARPDADGVEHLPAWAWWLETQDNPLDGDGGWQNEHWQWRYKLPPALCKYVGRVGWLWRNAAYSFAWEILGVVLPPETIYAVRGDMDVGDNPGHAGWLLITVPGYWEFYAVVPYGSRCLRIRLGWKLKGPCSAYLRGEQQAAQAMFVCSINPLKAYITEAQMRNSEC